MLLDLQKQLHNFECFLKNTFCIRSFKCVKNRNTVAELQNIEIKENPPLPLSDHSSRMYAKFSEIPTKNSCSLIGLSKK